MTLSAASGLAELAGTIIVPFPNTLMFGSQRGQFRSLLISGLSVQLKVLQAV
jgi:hypothetical protein